MGRRRGTEYEGVASPVPPGQSIPKKVPRGIANAGSGTPIVPPNPPAPVVLTEDLEFYLVSDGQTANRGGSGITVKNLSAFNAAFNQLGYSFPGSAADVNEWCRTIQIPVNYDNTRPIVATLHVIGETPIFDTTGFRAYYTLNEASGTRFDSTSNHNDLVTINGHVQSVAGKVNNALDTGYVFEADSSVTSAASTTLGLGPIDFNVFGWINQNGEFEAVHQIAGATQWFLDYIRSGSTTTGTWQFSHDRTVGGAALLQSSPFSPDSAWHFVMLEHLVASKTFNLYVDDVVTPLVTTTYTGTLATATANTVRIGSGLNSVAAVYFDETGIVGRALTAPEKAQIYNGGAGSTWPDF